MEKTMNKSISVTCGIYNTEYRLIARRNGELAVKAPVVKWDKNNNGALAFTKYEIVGESMTKAVLAFFESDTLLLEATNNCGALTLQDVLDGHMQPGVEVIAA